MNVQAIKYVSSRVCGSEEDQYQHTNLITNFYQFIINEVFIFFIICQTDYKTNTVIAKELNITPVLDKVQHYRRNWMQHTDSPIIDFQE
jgi:histone deacetylase complex regulatory component SIN3